MDYPGLGGVSADSAVPVRPAEIGACESVPIASPLRQVLRR